MTAGRDFKMRRGKRGKFLAAFQNSVIGTDELLRPLNGDSRTRSCWIFRRLGQRTILFKQHSHFHSRVITFWHYLLLPIMFRTNKMPNIPHGIITPAKEEAKLLNITSVRLFEWIPGSSGSSTRFPPLHHQTNDWFWVFDQKAVLTLDISTKSCFDFGVFNKKLFWFWIFQ
jgi:hypothetical protein